MCKHMFEQFCKQDGLWQNFSMVLGMFFSLFFCLTPATTPTVVTQFICTEHTVCDMPVIRDACVQKLTCFSVALSVSSGRC